MEASLPIKEEVIVEVALTKIQKKYYKAVYEKNFGVLNSKRTAKNSLINIGMQLRKVCSHPYLLEGAEADEIVG